MSNYFSKIKLKNIIIVALIAVFMQLFASEVLTGIISAFPKISEEYSETIDTLTELSASTILFVCLLAPFLEEFIFRGIVMQLVRLKYSHVLANVLQAALFSIYHDNIVQKIYAFLLGLLIGYLVYSLENIFYGIVFHMFMNTSGVLEQNFFPQAESIMLQIVIAAISLICMIILFLYLYKKGKAENVSE